MERARFDVIIVGAGIVGSATAAFLSESHPGCRILVIDRSLSSILGSTGYAPGLVGQLNVSPVLTALAKESVREYKAIGSEAFQTVGCLELVATDQGIREQKERLELAQRSGITVEALDHGEVLRMLPPFVREESFRKALYFPEDGVADPQTIVRTYREQAASRNVLFEEGDVFKIFHPRQSVYGIETLNGRMWRAPKVLLTTGIWTADFVKTVLQRRLPIIPVAHPYVFSLERPQRDQTEPFIRWPERHVYARNHGAQDGFGTYDHIPVPVHEPGASAAWPWDQPHLDQAITEATKTCVSPDFAIGQKTCSMFAVTPDNLPLVGPFGVSGLWIAAGIWVTTAAGTARFLAKQLMGEEVDEKIQKALDPGRFGSTTMAALEKQSLEKYNDIYLTEEKPA